VDRLVQIEVLGIVAFLALTAHLTLGPRRGSPSGLGRLGPARGVWSRLARSRPADVPGAVRQDRTASSDAVWLRRLAAEQARCERHGRMATVVAMHLGGPTGALGRRSAWRVRQHARLAERLVGASRATDVVRAGSDGIIQVLLAETDEDGARAFARRVADLLPTWGAELQAETSLTAAWADARVGRDLRSAHRLALARLRGASAGWLRSSAARTAPDRPATPRRALGRAADED
jgi:hypothetical protein